MEIDFRDVTYIYKGANKVGNFVALSQINLNVKEKNEFITICGHTGSGKSTLVKHFNALLRPTTGVVNILDTTVKHKNKVKVNHLRQKVGLVFQFPEYQLFEETVLKDVMFGPLNFGMSHERAKTEAIKACEMLNIDKSLYDKSPLKLSGGQMRKVAIAGILAMKPRVLVLDEPTRGLDPQTSEDVLNLLKQLSEESSTSIILITHDMNIVNNYAKRVIVMKKSKLVFDGTKNELFESTSFEDYELDYPDPVKILNDLNQKYGHKHDIYKYNFEDVLKELNK